MTHRTWNRLLLPRFCKRLAPIVILLGLLPLAASAQEVLTQVNFKECQPDTQCVVAFAPIEAGKVFTIQHASCAIVLSPKTANIEQVLLGTGTRGNITSLKHWLSPLSPFGSNTTRNFFAVSTPVLATVPADSRAMIRVRVTLTPSVYRVDCIVSGTQAPAS